MLTYKKSHRSEDNNEWWDSYDGKPSSSVAKVVALNNPGELLKTDFFKYITHRTTKTKSVALDFESLDGNIKATRFFNVGLKSSRGNNYPAKSKGQFIPPKHGAFVKFWLKTVGDSPERWCRVHKSLRSNLKYFIFKCSFELARDKSGEEYWRIKDILDTKAAQVDHNMGT